MGWQGSESIRHTVSAGIEEVQDLLLACHRLPFQGASMSIRALHRVPFHCWVSDRGVEPQEVRAG